MSISKSLKIDDCSRPPENDPISYRSKTPSQKLKAKKNLAKYLKRDS